MTNPTNARVKPEDAAAYALSTWGKTLEGTIEVDKLDAYGIMNDYNAEGGWQYGKINGTKTRVYTKYFTGTVPDLTAFSVAHGCTLSNILDFDVIVGGNKLDGVLISSAIAGATYITTVPQASLKTAAYAIAVHYIV